MNMVGNLLPGELTVVATQLDRCALRLEAIAAHVRVATATTWEGQAAQLHRQRVRDHADAIVALAAATRESAHRVRELQLVAERRLDLIGTVDLTVGIAR